MIVMFSVDLEPNKDGSLNDVRGAVTWFDRTVPEGTVFTTHRIATALPELVDKLRENHEIGVHVHPKEFGHDHDQLAELSRDRQAKLISTTREAIADAVDCDPDQIQSFRAGRHSASEETIDVLRNLGFEVDASVHVRYDDYLPESITRRNDPFEWGGLVEVPTSFTRLPILSRCGPRGVVTATANALRTDSWLCSGERAIHHLLNASQVVSMYMHPYDATDYHDSIENSGEEFRQRVERTIDALENRSAEFTTSSSLESRYPTSE